jgi:DNA replication protein DnaC
MSEENAVKRLRRRLDSADLDRMSIPRELWGAKVQNVPESVRDLTRRYLVHIDKMVKRGAGMYLFGPPGVGKSGIAALVCKEACSALYSAYWTSIWELRECIKSRIPFEEDTTVLGRCKAVDVLVLDNLSEEDTKKDYSFGVRDLEELVAHRGGRKRVTIITSRLNHVEMHQKFGALSEVMLGCMVNVNVEGQSLRVAKSEELKKTVFGDD